MSKRKRKKNSAPTRSGFPAKDKHRVTQPPGPGQSPGDDARRRAAPRWSQRTLLAIGLVLLAAAAFINWQRYRRQVLPPAVPFPVAEVSQRALNPLSQPTGNTRFTRLPSSETGITFAHPVIADHPMAYLYFSSAASGGTAIGDVNQDGRPDIFVASGPQQNKLYLQKETPFQFTDATEQAGVGGSDRWSCGATMVDINADGRLDIFVANYDAPNQLFLNLGNGTFQDRAGEYGLNMTDASLEGAFADYDRDGDLDLYLMTYRYENPAGMPSKPPILLKNGRRAIHPDAEKYYELVDDNLGYGPVGRWDSLLRNNGDGTFSNVTHEAGIRGPGHGQSVTWWDFNHDGFVDIHVGNDFNDPDRLYRNNGDGTFTNVVRDVVPHTTWFSMGADVGDVDRDGRLDLLSSDMSSTTHFKQKTTMGSMGTHAEFLATAVPRQYMRNALLLNSAHNRFREAAYLTGLESTDWTWSVKLADFDCDGLLDVFFTNGSVRSFTDSDLVLTLSERQGKTEWDIYKHTEPLRESNLAFCNQGNLVFENQSQAWGLDHLGVSMSAAHGDLDGDGDLDLVVANMDEPLAVYRNDSQENQRITLRLHGRNQNRFATGAVVTVETAAKCQVAQLQPTGGFLASDQPILHFGCGESTKVDVVIDWPDGTQQTIENLAANHHYEIAQQPGLPTTPRSESRATLFETQSLPAELTHQENAFDDYALQPLLPHRMSALGPGMAAGDANGDGHADIFVGGAMGHPGRVAVWQPDQKQYVTTEQSALLADKDYEDMGAIWLDVDQDGDVDLFVASGGNERAANSEWYQPRLYLNDGTGQLDRAPEAVPQLQVSAGPVCAADVDQDGDVDLFLGGRQVPGKYPLPASSYLLLNSDGQFHDATHSYFADQLTDVGMVTGALFSDVDRDDDLDLLLTREWDHMQLFRNENGRFVDASAEARLTGFRGWWTGITCLDCDNDGDLDYVATNLGENTKYHASDAKPFRIFYGDFEGDGKPKLVEAEYEAEKLFPVRGKSCSTHAMPSLAEKFTTYKQFAAATVEEIYTPRCLDEAYQCSANLLSHVLLQNDGSGRFELSKLPRDAQIAPGFGTVAVDFDADGIQDLFIAQNFFSPQPETGNLDGGLGTLLQGNGNGTFTAVSATASGIVVPQDAMATLVDDHRADGRFDLLVSTNNDVVHKITSQNPSSGVAIRFPTSRSTADLAGGRVEVRFADGTSQVYEIAAGNGYLSQQPPTIYFANPRQQAGTVTLTHQGRSRETAFTPQHTEVLCSVSE